MDVRKTFKKSLKELLTQLVSVTALNTSQRYKRGRDKNEYKFSVRYIKSQNKILFLHWMHLASTTL